LNSIVWGNDQINTYPGEDIYIANGAYAAVNYSDVGNVVNSPSNPGTFSDGGANFNSDPKFVAPENGNFHLRAGSPAIDQALCGSIVFSVTGPSTYRRVAPYFDFDGDRRPEGRPPGGSLFHLGCDCGADEFLRPCLAPIYLLLLLDDD